MKEGEYIYPTRRSQKAPAEGQAQPIVSRRRTSGSGLVLGISPQCHPSTIDEGKVWLHPPAGGKMRITPKHRVRVRFADHWGHRGGWRGPTGMVPTSCAGAGLKAVLILIPFYANWW